MERDKEFFNDHKIIVVDIETTGLSPKNGQIIEIGIAEVDINRGTIEPVFSEVMHERPLTDKEFDAWIFGNSTLETQDVVESLNIDEFRGQLEHIFEKYKWYTAYNAGFDTKFLKAAGFVLPRQAKCLLEFSREKLNLRIYSAEKVHQHLFNHNGKESHRGLNDAIWEGEILLKLLGHGD